MTEIEFQEWPKIPRLNREIVVTEKIDGTNACIIVQMTDRKKVSAPSENYCEVESFGTVYRVAAQSRKKLITPQQDNAGFARWVWENAEEIAAMLGDGYHFGEWWGKSVQRGYGLDHKRFSLFNTTRWGDLLEPLAEPRIAIVPEIYRGPFSQDSIEGALDSLRTGGSRAAPGYDRPEGVVVYHTAANQLFKVLLEGDEIPKGVTS